VEDLVGQSKWQWWSRHMRF